MSEKIVPKLRFSGFSDDWESMKIGDCLDVKYGKDYKHLNDGQYPVLGTGGVMEYVDDFLYSGESILIGRKGTIDKPKYINDSFWTVDTLFYTEIKKQFPKFLFYCICNINWLKYNEASGVPSLSANNIKNVKINVPSLNEQKKIANFITSIDYKIELLEKKYESYVDFKKYLMQQIFAQKLRFDNFDNEWEFKKLGQVSIVKDGTHDSPKYVLDGYPLITSKNLLNGEIDFENVNYISKEDYDNINKRSNVDKGDILFGMIGTIGNPLIVETDDFAIKNVALIKEKEELLNQFLIYVLETDFINRQFYRLNAGGTQKFIALGLIKDLLVPIPSIEEQLKISKFLSTVDISLNSYKNEISNMKKFKNGLLQQMFI